MSALFKNILVPVDFGVSTEVAVKQAVELACLHGSTIHLLHVIKPVTLWHKWFARTRAAPPLKDNYSPENVMIKLQQWRQTIEETLPNSKVNTYVREGVIQREIQVASSEIKPQLIIIGKGSCHKYFWWLDPICSNALAKSTTYPVLTVLRRSLHTKIKIIV